MFPEPAMFGCLTALAMVIVMAHVEAFKRCTGSHLTNKLSEGDRVPNEALKSKYDLDESKEDHSDIQLLHACWGIHRSSLTVAFSYSWTACSSG
jgi:hypothetical protein